MKYKIIVPEDISTWIDEKHKLEWEIENPKDPMRWEEGINYASSLGNGWKMATVGELQTLLDQNKSIRKEVPFSDSLIYWALDTYMGNPPYACYVDFSSGCMNDCSKTTHHYVRCVRDIE